MGKDLNSWPFPSSGSPTLLGSADTSALDKDRAIRIDAYEVSKLIIDGFLDGVRRKEIGPTNFHKRLKALLQADNLSLRAQNDIISYGVTELNKISDVSDKGNSTRGMTTWLEETVLKLTRYVKEREPHQATLDTTQHTNGLFYRVSDILKMRGIEVKPAIIQKIYYQLK